MKTLFLSVGILVWSVAAYSQVSFQNFDLNPSGGSYPHNMTTFNNKMFFCAHDDANGSELWISDGTVAGSHLLKDLNPGPDGSNPFSFIPYKGLLYFEADFSTDSFEIWKTDGTTSGTELVKTLYAGIEGNSTHIPTDLHLFNGNLYFAADSGNVGIEVWISDGTASGTKMFKDINPFTPGAGVISADPTDFFVFDNKLFFNINDDTNGFELWSTDGTVAGTQMVKDINPGPFSSDPHDFFVFNNQLYFVATTQTQGEELWITDGTSTGTRIFRDINPGTGNMSKTRNLEYCLYNNNFLFRANDGYHGDELWISDGTTTGTYLLKDINPGPLPSTPVWFTPANNKVFFTAANVFSGNELWTTDGTDVGTHIVKDILPGADSSFPGRVTEYDGHIYFVAESTKDDRQLFVSDGTSAGTYIIAPPSAVNTSPLVNNFHSIGLFPFDSSLFFQSNYDPTGDELWSIKSFPVTISKPIAEINFLNIYPNPSLGSFTVDFGNTNWIGKQIEIVNITGQPVYKAQASNKSVMVQLNNCLAGLYMLRVSDGKNVLINRKITLN